MILHVKLKNEKGLMMEASAHDATITLEPLVRQHLIAELQNRVANHSPHSQSMTERIEFQNVTGSSAARLLLPNFLPLGPTS